MRKILITLLICLLTCAQAPFAYSAGHEQTNFYDWCGVSPEGLVAWYYQGDSRGGNGDTQNVFDISGAGNHSEQTTASKQAGDYPDFWKFDGTDDYFTQERLLYLTGVTLEAMILGGEAGIRSDVYDLPDIIPSGSVVVLTDSSGVTKAMFYAGAACGAGAETLAANAITNGGFDSDASGWAPVNSTLASIAGGQSGNCLEITENGNSPYAYQNLNAIRTEGKLYLASWYVKAGTEASYRSNLNSGDVTYLPDNISREAAASWVQIGPFYYTCNGVANFRLTFTQFAGLGTGDTFLADTVSHQEVTNLGSTGLTAFSGTTPGASQSFNYIGTGFPWNDSSGYTIEVYRPGFNFRGSMSIAVIIKLDDGHPAAASSIVCKHYNSANVALASYIFQIATAGTIRFYTCDGIDFGDYETSNSAVFSDGVQSSYTMVGAIYNGTSVQLILNGLIIPSTTTGIIQSGLRDTALKTTIGAYGDGSANITGDIALVLLFSRTLSAGEMAKIYSACKRDGFL